MTITFRDYARAIASWLTLAIISAFITLLCFWEWGPVEQVYIPTHPELHKAMVVNDDYMYITRSFEVKEEVPLHVTRELRGKDDNGVFRVISMPSTDGKHDVGTYLSTVIVDLPKGVPPGTYEYVSRMSWQANPIRTVYVELPEIEVRINHTTH